MIKNIYMSSKRDHMLLNRSKLSFILKGNLFAALFCCGLIQHVKCLMDWTRLPHIKNGNFKKMMSVSKIHCYCSVLKLL